jgi:hypothetical protein
MERFSILDRLFKGRKPLPNSPAAEDAEIDG